MAWPGSRIRRTRIQPTTAIFSAIASYLRFGNAGRRPKPCWHAVPPCSQKTPIYCASDTAKLANVLKDLGLATSASAAYRLIEQGAVKVDGTKVESRDTALAAGSSYLLQAGKRGIARVTLRRS